MNATEFNNHLITIQQQAKKLAQRKLVVLAGDTGWAYSLLTPCTLFTKIDDGKPCYIFQENKVMSSDETNKAEIIFSSKPYTIINGKNYRHYLGSQCQYLIFDDSALNIDAFAALSGTLCAGGLLFLVMPNLNDTALLSHSLFLQRFVKQIKNNKEVIVFEQNSPEPINLTLSSLESKSPELKNASLQSNFDLGCKTKEQLAAVEAIKKVMLGHRNRPLVLTADRGRGKSSALAIACANLIENTKLPLNIIISAPHAQALTVFFQQLASSLPNAIFDKLSLTFTHYNLPSQPSSKLFFLPMDILLDEKPTANLILIDEAAAIPVYLLEQLIQVYHRVVFSTTLHGYEGAGRGFALKFQQSLAKQQPQWQALHINEPIRWAVNDPLEQFVFSSCLLNARLSDVSKINEAEYISKKGLPTNKMACNELEFTHHDKISLIENEITLSQLFSVLVTAHYQTSPSDLRLMLDNNQVDIVSLSDGKKIIAVALLMHEGECEQQTIQGILQGSRRLKNQFLPQSLMNHCGFEQAFNYRYLRVMRIAVHPSLHHQGIGRYFLGQIEHYAKQRNCDILGTSFGANTQLLQFWLSANFSVIRIGFTKDQASGEHSALLFKSLTKKAVSAQKMLSAEFYRSFSYLLSEQYQYLVTDLVALIFSAASKEQLAPLTTFDTNNVDAFVHKKRLYSTCAFSLHLWLQQHLAMQSFNRKAATENEHVSILIARILQKQSIAKVCQQFQLKGKKALNQRLLDYVGRHYCKVVITADPEINSG